MPLRRSPRARRARRSDPTAAVVPAGHTSSSKRSSPRRPSITTPICGPPRHRSRHLRLGGERPEAVPDGRFECVAELVASRPSLDGDELVAIGSAQDDSVDAAASDGPSALLPSCRGPRRRSQFVTRVERGFRRFSVHQFHIGRISATRAVHSALRRFAQISRPFVSG